MKKEITKEKIIMLVGAGITFLMIAITMFLLWKKEWRFDAMDYWMRGSMLAGGELPDGSRGIIFPAWLALAIRLGGRKAWFVFYAALTFLFCAVVMPRMTDAKDEKTGNKMRGILAFTILIGVFFAGLVAYPLSDLPALICIAAACVFARKALDTGLKNSYRLIYFFLTGMLSYFAYNIRTIYLFSAIVLFVIVVAGILREEKSARSLPRIGSLAAGALLGGVPQGVMNLMNLGKFSLRVHTGGLMLQELRKGFFYQRFDLFTGNTAEKIVGSHPISEVFFFDPASQTILRTEGIAEINSWGEWIAAALSRPIDMLVVCARHFVNMIFPCFPQIYVEDLNAPKWPMGVLGFTILFLTVFGMLRHLLKSTSGMKYFLPMILPALMVLPGAVEYRFGVGLYVFAFYQLCFNFDYQKLKALSGQEKVKTVLIWAIMLLLVFAIWGSMLVNESVSPLYM